MISASDGAIVVGDMQEHPYWDVPFHYDHSKYLVAAAFFAAGALAVPVAEPGKPPSPAPSKPTQPTKPSQPTATVVSQTNQCGNDATPYCCNTDNKGKYTLCSLLSTGSTCSQTTVCCNANNSIQVCLGDAQISV